METGRLEVVSRGMKLVQVYQTQPNLAKIVPAPFVLKYKLKNNCSFSIVRFLTEQQILKVYEKATNQLLKYFCKGINQKYLVRKLTILTISYFPPPYTVYNTLMILETITPLIYLKIAKIRLTSHLLSVPAKLKMHKSFECIGKASVINSIDLYCSYVFDFSTLIT